MNIHDKKITNPEVTTGPLVGSRKVYSSPEGHEDVRVPFRQIELSDGAPASSSEAVGISGIKQRAVGHKRVFRVYDPSGPYTDSDAAIDVKRGLDPLRMPWIEARGGVERYDGRTVKPEDNGNVGASHLAQAFTVTRQTRAAFVLPPPEGGGSGGGRERM